MNNIRMIYDFVHIELRAFLGFDELESYHLFADTTRSRIVNARREKEIDCAIHYHEGWSKILTRENDHVFSLF